jgi:ankyrin repeat protein
MSVPLPERPSLEYLRKQARALLRDVQRGDPAAVARLRDAARLPPGTDPQLAHAQLAIAREHGFASWTKLKTHIEDLESAQDPLAALLTAVRAGDVERARRLLSRHPSLAQRLDEPVGDFGGTLLIAAAGAGNAPLVELLLDAGADVNARSDWWAGSFGVLDMCPPAMAPLLIARGARVDAHAAARLGMLERLAELLDADPSLVHARGGDGMTPLHFAASVEIARLLVMRGADIDALDVDHESTPAQHMIRDRQEVARWLVERGARTDILMASALGDVDRVRAHLKADRSSIATTVSPLFFPMRDPRAGGTIYNWTLGRDHGTHRVAHDFGHPDVYALLMERTPPPLALAAACEVGDDARVEALLAADASLAASLPDALRMRLVSAAMNDEPDGVRRLLAAGWPADARGHDGATALHWAAWHGDLELARELLHRGASPSVRERSFGGTPLSWAVHASVHGWHPERGDYAAVVELLAAAGAPLPDEIHGSAPVRQALLRLGAASK